MPIRLLCFQPHGSGLQISLLERGAIHARLESALRANIHEPDHIPQTTSKKKETEEKAIQRLISRYARYAILSHAWLSTAAGEVTYSNWTKGVFDAQDPGYQKLVNFCKTAWKNHGLVFGWMDTVCIDKESSAELDESIRSMFNWYRRAHMCVIYLSETMTVSNMHMDRWFTRGWTLQELLAPRVIKFYNGDWKELVKGSNNDKMVSQTIEQIERATTISEGELSDIYSSPISRRMQLAANRIVTREEDMAYSLMGIFSISISTAYGEGADRAFSRLLREILNSYEEGVLDMLNWAGPLPDSRPHCSMLLPPSPRYYLCRSSIIDLFVGMLGRPIAPLTLTHLGLHIPVILMPAVSISGESIQHDAIGDFNATVDISPDTHYDDFPTTYNVLDKRISGPDGSNKDNNGWYQITLAVFNFGGNKLNLFIPKTCTARGMEFV
ncbi:hypothetical protein BJ912DRAFT_111867 [Pholiota molesta]|nr:hypothetical protein BJ912DRAFT_111867 [Pholiota molesta]